MAQRSIPRPCACGCGRTTKGGVWVPGHDWQSPTQRKAAEAARVLAAADDRPRSPWEDPQYEPGPVPEVVAARSRLAVLREAGEW